jgi:hypothetical protein
MKTLKSILVLISISMIYIHTSAQSTVPLDSARKRICDQLMKSNYAFEGKVISVKKYQKKIAEGYSKEYKGYGTTFENYYCYVVEVQKVVKGNLVIGTVKVFEDADGVVFAGNGYTESAGRAEKAMVPSGAALFFCFNAANLQSDTVVSASNTQSLRFYEGDPISGDTIIKSQSYGLSWNFSTLTEFYTYLNANYLNKN